jgi:inner membrane protein
MLFKTHIAIGIFAIILFLPLVSNHLGFAIITLIASALPDIDTPFSKFGRNKASKTLQVFTEHRGMFHSITICLLLTLILSFFIPKLAFGFFLGYSMHLLADGFTKAGITPFWPYSRKAKGMLKVGGVAEKGIFFTFVVVDFLLLLIYLI